MPRLRMMLILAEKPGESRRSATILEARNHRTLHPKHELRLFVHGVDEKDIPIFSSTYDFPFTPIENIAIKYPMDLLLVSVLTNLNAVLFALHHPGSEDSIKYLRELAENKFYGKYILASEHSVRVIDEAKLIDMFIEELPIALSLFLSRGFTTEREFRDYAERILRKGKYGIEPALRHILAKTLPILDNEFPKTKEVATQTGLYLRSQFRSKTDPFIKAADDLNTNSVRSVLEGENPISLTATINLLYNLLSRYRSAYMCMAITREDFDAAFLNVSIMDPETPLFAPLMRLAEVRYVFRHPDGSVD